MAAQTSLADLTADCFAHCCRWLSPRDLVNLSFCCSSLRQLSNSDAAWACHVAHQWTPSRQAASCSGFRQAFIERHVAAQKLQIADPATCAWLLIRKGAAVSASAGSRAHGSQGVHHITALLPVDLSPFPAALLHDSCPTHPTTSPPLRAGLQRSPVEGSKHSTGSKGEAISPPAVSSAHGAQGAHHHTSPSGPLALPFPCVKGSNILLWQAAAAAAAAAAAVGRVRLSGPGLSAVRTPTGPLALPFPCVQGSNILLWRAQSTAAVGREQLSAVFPAHKGRITALLPVDLSPFPAAARLVPPLPSHTFLLSTSLDRTLRLWGKAPHILAPSHCSCFSSALSPPTQATCLRTFSGHTGPILCLSDRIIGISHPCSFPLLLLLFRTFPSHSDHLSAHLLRAHRSHPLPLRPHHRHLPPVHGEQQRCFEHNPPFLLASVARDAKVWLFLHSLFSHSPLNLTTSPSPSPSPSPLVLPLMPGTTPSSWPVLLETQRLWRLGQVREEGAAEGIDTAGAAGAGGQFSAAGMRESKVLSNCCQSGQVEFKLLACSKAHNSTVDLLYVDGYKCISGSRGDGVLCVWDVETGEEIRTLDATALPPWMVDTTDDASEQGDHGGGGAGGDAGGGGNLTNAGNHRDLTTGGDIVDAATAGETRGNASTETEGSDWEEDATAGDRGG
ncbi:unnamed protein product [Closterium sp. Yama58-4]|nr:unnamed protein product [Closterium sp. Yama58-4]